ncbi:HD-GYP domain-containing protein [Aeoliella sp.]|uniref:HD-GYP domain-containing protein n=1 Tax=Aeoliella sp. TaxID=2795800 RepID=UPI003CCBBF00
MTHATIRSESNGLQQLETTSRAALIAAMSYALDITEGQPPGHAARTCLIGMRLAQVLQLSAAERDSLYYALLLKDLGCSSNAAKMCYLFGADDRTVKRDVKTVDWAKMSASFQFITSHVAPQRSPLERAMKIAATLLQGPGSAKKLIETRCERGADLARRMGFDEATATGILQLDEHWDGCGHPVGLKGEEIGLPARIMGLAQTVEVFHSEFGRDAALAMASQRRGGWFDPALVDALVGLGTDDRLWSDLLAPNPHELAERLAPQEHEMSLDEAGVDRIAEAYAAVVDAKSPWTHKHSQGVADICIGMGKVLGLPQTELRALRRIGLLHDIGKLGVSNSVLDKPGKLTEAEFDMLKTHPEHSHAILSRTECFSEVAEVAASHHEKLDGSGYHRGLSDRDLPIASRIVTVADMFEAMTASRPYREGMAIEKVMDILKREGEHSVCPDSVEALQRWLDGENFESRVNQQLEAVENLVAEL